MRSKIFIIILLALGFGTRFIYFGYPNQVVFDEVYFGKYAIEYTTGNYFFDPHPPLGKLILAAEAKLSPTTLTPEAFQTIGQPYPNNTYQYLRFLPTLLGALLPLLIYLLAKKLLKSENAAFIAGLLTTFETLFIGQSRFAYIDMFLVFFGILGLVFYFHYRTASEPENRRLYNNKNILLVLAVIFTSLAACVKWTGISYLALIGLIEIADLMNTKARFSQWLVRALLSIGIFGLLYVGFFAIHFAILTKSGEGDAFMTAQFQKTLAGSQYQNDQSLAPMSFVDKLQEIHKVILDSEKGLEETPHPYGSKWYTWPLMTRPIYYWVDTAGTSRIYLFGNVLIFWLSTIAVTILTIRVIRKIGKAIWVWKRPSTLFLEIILLMGFFGNWLPFVAVHRVMFLYHYFSALLFAYIILVYEISLIKNRTLRNCCYGSIVVLSVIGYIYFFPIIYGTPLSQEQYMSKIWLKSWI